MMYLLQESACARKNNIFWPSEIQLQILLRKQEIAITTNADKVFKYYHYPPENLLPRDRKTTHVDFGRYVQVRAHRGYQLELKVMTKGDV